MCWAWPAAVRAALAVLLGWAWLGRKVAGAVMGLKDEEAAAIYGLYTALVYLAALPGGWVGDRLIGAKSAVWWGGVVIAIGHLVLGIDRKDTFFLGLLIVVMGSGLLN